MDIRKVVAWLLRILLLIIALAMCIILYLVIAEFLLTNYTATPITTATIESIATPVSTATIEPTATPITTATIEPIVTPVSTATIEPTATLITTATIEPTATPAPTASIKPTATPASTVAVSEWEMVKVVASSKGHIVGLDFEESLISRKMTTLDIDKICTELKNVVIPVDNEKDRLNGRFVRSKFPHVVEVDPITQEIIAGYSSILMRLEPIDEESLMYFCGKDIDEITAQDVIDVTLVVKLVDGRYLAGHKTAPGFRGPLVAKLHLENGRYLRVERWNYDTKNGDTPDKGTPTLVLVICSEQHRTRE